MSQPFTIGDLRHRVTIEAVLDVVDDLGGLTRSFAPFARVWAHIETLAVTEDFVEQRLEQTKRLAVTIRWRDDVESQMRFDFKGRKLLIVSVKDSEERRNYLTCICEEIT